MARLFRIAALVLLATATMATAADHPIGGDRLLLKDAPNAARRIVSFRASRDPEISPTLAADPRSLGASIEINGSALGDGTTGPIVLDAGSWTGIGSPAGSRGFKYRDIAAESGVTKVLFRSGRSGGSLLIRGGGDRWPYTITQPQAAIDVRFTIGPERYCARFTSFAANEAGRVLGRDAAAPAVCSGPVCGNGTAEGAEECDDGNVAGGDGCSANCELESVAALCAGVPTVAGTAITSVRVASGLQLPVHVAAPPLDPNRIFVVEQGGRIRIVKDGSLLSEAFLAIEDKVSCCGERGLLSIAFHPDFESNGRFFVNYTDTNGNTVIARYLVGADPDHADAASERIILTVTQPFANHNGGLLAFGPDGRLYAGMGDGGGAGDPLEAGQDDATRLGKLLRIDTDTATVETWAKGLRNPWRFSFDRATDDLYLADVGEGLWEEVNVQPAPITSGLNYGWDVFEGSHCFDPQPLFADCPSPPTGFTMPVLEYCHSQNDPACGAHPRGCSVTGGFVYRGCAMPDVHGTYFYSDYCSAFIRTFRGVSGGAAQNLADRTADLAPGGGLAIGRVSSFGEDARGEIYIVDHGSGAADGEVFKIVPGN